MITKVYAKGLKGLDFEQPLSRLNLLVGPNGVGKSARADALTLAVLGYVPGVAKKNGEILSTFGCGNKIFVGIETDSKTSFLRRYCRNEEGAVSCDLMLNRRKASREAYAAALAGVKLFDLGAFLDLSDQRKIDVLFSLFPPASDLGELDGKIEGLKAKQNKLQADIRSLDQTRARLTSARAGIQLPAGTLAEITAKIKEVESKLADAGKSLEAARVEQVRREAEEKAKREAIELTERERTRIEAEAKAKADSEAYVRHQAELQAEREKTIREMEAKQAATPPPPEKHFSEAQAFNADPAESIRAILETLQRAGCTACAAALVAKRELRKYQQRKVA